MTQPNEELKSALVEHSTQLLALAEAVETTATLHSMTRAQVLQRLADYIGLQLVEHANPGIDHKRMIDSFVDTEIRTAHAAALAAFEIHQAINGENGHE